MVFAYGSINCATTGYYLFGSYSNTFTPTPKSELSVEGEIAKYHVAYTPAVVKDSIHKININNFENILLFIKISIAYNHNKSKGV